MSDHTRSWPELAEGLYERLTGRNAEISYQFDTMEIDVPSGTGPNAEHAHWKLNGTLKITTRDNAS